MIETTPDTLTSTLNRLQFISLVVGIACFIFCGIGGAMDPAQFFNSYLFSYLFWLGVSLGSLALVMLYHMTGGDWGRVIERPAEAAARNLPMLAILFIPIAFGYKYLFNWAQPAEVINSNHILKLQSLYLNPMLVNVRMAIYFAITIALAYMLSNWSVAYDKTDDIRIARRMRKYSAGGLVAYFLIVTFMAVDLVMSRELGFYSTIIGFIMAVGTAASAMVFHIAFLRILATSKAEADFFTPDRLHDLGKLFFTLIILWAYVNFSQFLVIWMGNTAPDSIWYVRRGIGNDPNNMRFVGLLLVIFHFFVPFFCLLFKSNKRNLRKLTALAAGVLVMRVVDNYWLAGPSNLVDAAKGGRGLHLNWMDFLMPIAIGGIWMATFTALLRRRRPLVPHEEERDVPFDPSEHPLPAPAH